MIIIVIKVYITNNIRSVLLLSSINYINIIIKYFIKAEKIEDYTTTQKAIEEAMSAKLQELPKNPNLISEEIQNILPFKLPIKKRSQTAAIVNTLRIIYNFSQLPETYFKELPQLPKEPYDLLIEMRYVFLICSRNQLQ